MPSAASQPDPGTTVVVSANDLTLVGGTSDDKLVLLADRLAPAGGGSPGTIGDSSDTVQLKGGWGIDIPGASSSFQSYIFTTATLGADGTPAGNSGAYSYQVNYEKRGNDLEVVVESGFPTYPSGQPSGEVGSGWDSDILIKNFHNGDYGITLTEVTGDAPGGGFTSGQSYADAQNQAMTGLTAGPEACSSTDDDSSVSWAGCVPYSRFADPYAVYDDWNNPLSRALDDDAIASALASVTSVNSGGDRPTPPAPGPTTLDLVVSDSNVTETLAGDATATVTGDGDTINAIGLGSTIQFGGTRESAIISDGTVELQVGSGGRVAGDRNVVTLADHTSLALEGDGNIVTLKGTDAIVDDEGNGDSFNVEGPGAVLTLEGQNATVTGAGTGSDLSLQATGDTVTVNAGQVDLWGGIMASVSGIGDAIYLDTGDTLTLSGSGHKVTLGQGANTVDDEGNGFDSFNVEGPGAVLTRGPDKKPSRVPERQRPQPSGDRRRRHVERRRRWISGEASWLPIRNFGDAIYLDTADTLHVVSGSGHEGQTARRNGVTADDGALHRSHGMPSITAVRRHTAQLSTSRDPAPS